MSRILAALALGLFALPASAQIGPYTIASIFQEGDIRGRVLADLPPGPCRSIEYWFLYSDYTYPDARGGGFSIEGARAGDMGLSSFLRAMYAADPKGTLVTVEIEETSAACP